MTGSSAKYTVFMTDDVEFELPDPTNKHFITTVHGGYNPYAYDLSGESSHCNMPDFLSFYLDSEGDKLKGKIKK